MASQLALLFARRLEVPVLLTDVDQERLDRGLGYLQPRDRRRCWPRAGCRRDRANRLRALVTGTLDLADFADADFVIEAVFEELALKQQVFADLEKVVRAGRRPGHQHLVAVGHRDGPGRSSTPSGSSGFHFFNPVAVMPLLEIARTEPTDERDLRDRVRRRAGTLKKTCIAVRDAPGFVVNRLFMRMFNEVTRAIDEGTPFDVADHALDPLGLPMTPLQLIGFTGPRSPITS